MGKESPWHHLWRLLDHHAFGAAEALRRFPAEARQRHFIRRTKEEMVDLAGNPLYRQRRCRTFSFDLTGGEDGEEALYLHTTAWLREHYNRAHRNRSAAQLAMSVFQRRLASSTSALLRSFERRIEKLERDVADWQSGRLDAESLAHRERLLARRQRADFFDTHGADEDVREDGATPGERSEDFEDAVLGAVTAVTIEELRREVEVLQGLRARALALIEAGDESKFEKLREVLEDPRYAEDKWLVFSEHRDTVDFLVRRIEGLGYSDQVAVIHGGMAWPERDEQVERFREPDGARFLVATDAAGEGINLQFCRLMVNYDIPWNPARLEQRMGRIHRYGQKHDVRVVNLVAGGTREGRVLEVLLDKLESVRRALSSDKVFDVIGRLLANTSLREFMIDALTDEGEQRALQRIERSVTESAVQRHHGTSGEGVWCGRRGRAPALRHAPGAGPGTLSPFAPGLCAPVRRVGRGQARDRDPGGSGRSVLAGTRHPGLSGCSPSGAGKLSARVSGAASHPAAGSGGVVHLAASRRAGVRCTVFPGRRCVRAPRAARSHLHRSTSGRGGPLASGRVVRRGRLLRLGSWGRFSECEAGALPDRSREAPACVAAGGGRRVGGGGLA